MKKSLLKIINEILKEKKIEILEIYPEMNLRNDIGFDSLNLAYLTVLIEEEYGVDNFENGIVDTISDILKKINE